MQSVHDIAMLILLAIGVSALILAGVVGWMVGIFAMLSWPRSFAAAAVAALVALIAVAVLTAP